LVHKIFMAFSLIIVFDVSASCNFISANFLDELSDPSYIKEIQVEVPKSAKFNRNFVKILLSKSENIPPNLRKKFKAKINVVYPFGICKYKASVKQSGDWKDHIAFSEGRKPLRSLSVKLKDGNILNAVRFKLLIPETRNNLHEILGTIFLREIGYIAPESFQVITRVNGDTALMIFQEDAEKELLERNNRREGPLLEGDENLLWSYKNYDNFELESLSLARVTNEKWFLKGPSARKITLDAYGKLQHAYLDYSQDIEGKRGHIIYPNQGKVDTFTQYFLALMSLNGQHALVPHNRRFYYNSFSQSLEPIYFDGMLSLTKPIKITEQKDLLISALEKLPSFKYTASFLNLQNTKRVLEAFKKRSLLSDYKAEVFFNKSLLNIQSNERKIQSLLANLKNRPIKKNNTKQSFSSYFSNPNYQNLQQTTLLKITKDMDGFIASTFDKQQLKLSYGKVAKIISKNKLDGSRHVFLPDTFNGQNEKNYHITDFGSPLGKVRHSKTLSIKIDKKLKTIFFKQEKLNDWVLFSGADFSGWSIVFEGLKLQNNTYNLTSDRLNHIGLTGCLNFYKSFFNETTVRVSHGGCEDSLNIVNSKGSIKDANISDAFADGIDIDFSKIAFGSVTIDRAGNDCLDVSSGQYIVSKLKASSCGDKGVSVGEKSQMNISRLQIDNASLGVSSKDFSVTSIDKAELSNIVTCYEAAKKKQEFGGGKLIIKKLDCIAKNIVDSNSLVLIGEL
jgi:hypothetical protein